MSSAKIKFGKILIQTESQREMPREKLLLKGAGCLSDEELSALLIGSGNRRRGVFAIASDLVRCMDCAKGIPRLEDLLAINGIGEARATLICAALEFSRRRFSPGKVKVSGPEDIFRLVNHVADRDRENFMVITLNGANEVISQRITSTGLVNKTLVHPRESFVDAILDRAAAVVLAHNHPSGNVSPSIDDKGITERLVHAGKILGIPVLDHIVFSHDKYYSFLEHGELKN